jgi:hypothetical protein
MIKRNNIYFGTKLYEKALVTNNQYQAQQIGGELIKYKTIFNREESTTDWVGIAEYLGYPKDNIFNHTNGKLKKEFNDIIRALQELALTGEHRHPLYRVYYLHNQEIIAQN